jgi:hypothetical protein
LADEPVLSSDLELACVADATNFEVTRVLGRFDPCGVGSRSDGLVSVDGLVARRMKMAKD